ncbi:MAG: SdrD B-like domain-containing protein [Rhodoglobus sp.]
MNPIILRRPLASARTSGRRSRTRTLSFATVISLFAALLSLTGVGVTARAAGELLQVNLVQEDGTATFDAADGAGLDSGPSNGIVRTNDSVTYNVEVRVEGATAENTTFTMVLPLGYEMTGVPALCTGPGSSVTPASLGDLPLPLTSTSYQAFPQQTLVCNIGQRTPGSTLTYPMVVKVRSEVPNGEASGPVTASVVSDDVSVPSVSNEVSTTVSASPRWNLSKNSINTQENTGYFYREAHPCPWDASLNCMGYAFSVLLGSENGGKGTTPLTGPITFTDDLTPGSFFPAGTTTSVAWLAAGAGAVDKYAPRLQSCVDLGNYNSPAANIGGSGSTDVNSVRDSGSIDCQQPGGPGTPVNITITGTDSTLATYPTEVAVPAGNAIPANKAYIVSQMIYVDLPIAAITDLGLDDGITQSLVLRNEFEDLAVTSIDGQPNQAGADETWDNYREWTDQVRTQGTFNKQFGGVAGDPKNTPAGEYSPGYGWIEGPPGNNTINSGSITVAPGQTVISGLIVKGANGGSTTPGTAVMCDAWDPTKLTLAPGNYGTSGAVGQLYPSNGEAVWFSGILAADPNPTYRIEYSTGPGGAGDASTCDDGTWYNTPGAVPGGVDAVSRVRIWTTLGGDIKFGINDSFFSIALRVNDAATTGEILPNWAGVMFHFGAQQSLEEMFADSANTWSESTYDPSNHSGSLGDRLIAAPAFSRIIKEVKGPKNADFSNLVPITTGGEQVQYRLSPSLTSAAATSSVAKNVWVEDCLPAGQNYLSATLTPSVISTTTPAGAAITCQPRDTYLRWDLGARVPNDTIDPIDVTVRVSPVAASGVYTNNTIVSADEDPSTPEQRSAFAQVQVVQPAGVKIDKVALTPVVELNRTEEATKDPLLWRIDLGNIQAPGSLSDVDIIDVLPSTGDNGSSFAGTLAFSSANVVSGGSATMILYTKSAATVNDPSDASNGAAGSTVWCDAPTGGAVVHGNGSAADCPATATEVTALRILRPGAFLPSDLVSVELTMLADGNNGGDIYVNSAFGRVAGLQLPVGPVDAPEHIVASSIGDYVWVDTNADGIQDAGETPLAGFPVSLSGTDSDGNPVSRTTTTDANGKYLFDGLQSGNYTVSFDPAGLKGDQRFTIQNTPNDGAVDSDGDPTTGQTAPIALGVDEQNLTIDQGVIAPPATLVVSKTVTGTGSAGPYRFTVICTLNGQPYTLSDGDAEFTLSHGESRTITVISGVDCTVAEVNAPADATVTVSDSDSSSAGGDTDGVVTDIVTTAAVAFTNAYSGPTVISPPKGSPADLAHTGLTSLIPGLLLTGLGLVAGLVLLVIARRRNRIADSRR